MARYAARKLNMNKNTVIVLVLTALIGGGLFFVNSQSDTKPESSSNVKMERVEPESTSQVQTLDDNSKYIEYSKEALESAKGTRRVLYFYASWCPTCRPADADFKSNVNKFPEDLVLIRVNYNDPETDQEEKDLAKKYAITYQHTFVQIDNSRNEVKKWNGGKTEELLANIK